MSLRIIKLTGVFLASLCMLVVAGQVRPAQADIPREERITIQVAREQLHCNGDSTRVTITGRNLDGTPAVRVLTAGDVFRNGVLFPLPEI